MRYKDLGYSILLKLLKGVEQVYNSACQMKEKKQYTYSTKQLAKSSITSLGFKAVGMLLSVVISPLILEILGEYKYGVWASVLSLTSWIYTFDLGIGSSIKNKVSASLVKEDYEAARAYISISYILTATISIIGFLAIIILIHILDFRKLFGFEKLDESINNVLLVAFGLICINFVLVNIQNVLMAMQKVELVQAYSTFAQILYYIGLLLCRKYALNYILIVAALQGSSQAIKNIIATINIFYSDIRLRPDIKLINWKYAHGFINFGIKAFTIQIASVVLNSTDNLVISKCLDASLVTPYDFCHKYFGIISNVYMIILSPFWVGYSMAYEKKDNVWIKKTLKQSMGILSLFTIGVVFAAVMFLPFSKIWLGKLLNYQKGLVPLVATYFGIQMFASTFASFLMGTGNVDRLFVVNILQAIANIPLSVYLTINMDMGVNGVIIGSIAVMALGAVIAVSESMKVIKEINEGN